MSALTVATVEVTLSLALAGRPPVDIGTAQLPIKGSVDGNSITLEAAGPEIAAMLRDAADEIEAARQ